VSILTSIVENPSYIVGKIPLMSQNERHKIISDWNDTTTDLPYNTTLDKLFKEQVVRTPNAMAVIFENESLSYNELDIWSNSIAESLINNGVTTGALVAICAERSLEMVAGLWGILKAGSAYIPIDPDYPSARIEYIIKDSQTPLILIQKTLIGKVGLHDTVKILPIEEYQNIKPKLLTLKTNITPDNIAYVIYTSGSTGKPKGVMIQHKGICNRLLWMQKEFKISNSDKIVQKTPYTFDVSVWEFFWPLITGATLVMARPGGHKDAAYLAEIIKKEKITVVHFVPSMLNYFVEEKNAPLCKNLRYVICSGETLTKGHQENFFRRMPEHIRLYNLYGPTEASVDVSFWECKRNDSHYIVPIGKPIDNIQLYILDEFMQPVPTGVYGHLYIGGVGLAKGYLNLNQLTEANFIHNPFADNSGSDRIYKTGDIARWLEDGSIEYSGRLDFQIKIRGFRIEPGEIEECISKIVNVVECTVIVKEKQHIGKYIVAFVVASGLNSQGIRSLLQNQLPEYMIPSYFVFIDNMPQTSSGKVDRKALALYDIKRDTAVNDTIIKPKNETEQIIAEIWKEKIGVSSISVVDNFFDIGGHSLLLAEINIILKQKFSASISMVTMFQYPTIASLAEYIDNKNATEHTPLNNIYNRADLQRKYLQKNSKKNNNAI
jgi:amino acid adenylation domain-containing protein